MISSLVPATTAAVAHKMNRQWITVEQMDYVETITMERLKKVVGKKVKAEGKLLEEIDYDTGGISKSVNWQGGGDFIYCELMPYNQAYMDKIQAAQSSEELVALWRDIAENSFLNWYVNPEIPTEAVDDFIEIGKGEGGWISRRNCWRNCWIRTSYTSTFQRLTIQILMSARKIRR